MPRMTDGASDPEEKYRSRQRANHVVAVNSPRFYRENKPHRPEEGRMRWEICAIAQIPPLFSFFFSKDDHIRDCHGGREFHVAVSLKYRTKTLLPIYYENCLNQRDLNLDFDHFYNTKLWNLRLNHFFFCNCTNFSLLFFLL